MLDQKTEAIAGILGLATRIEGGRRLALLSAASSTNRFRSRHHVQADPLPAVAGMRAFVAKLLFPLLLLTQWP